MKFISIRAVAKAIDFRLESIDLITLRALTEALDKLDPSQKLNVDGVEYSIDEIKMSFAQIQQENQLVFQDWITNDTAFYALLTKEQVTLKQPEKKRFQGHFLEQDFYVYLSQFLFPVLQRKLRVSIDQGDYQTTAFCQELSNYLTKESRIIIHQSVSQGLKDVLTEKSTELLLYKNSEELIAGLKIMRNSAFVDCFNLLDKSLYSTRIEFVKFLKSVINDPKSDVLVIRSFRSNLLRLALNPEQKEELDGFLDASFTKVKKTIGKSTDRWAFAQNRYFWGVLALMAVVTSISVVFNKTEIKADPPHQISGLDSLNTEQIVNVDTLLGLDLTDPEVILEDQDDVFQPDLTFTFPSQELKNESVKSLHSSMIKDYNQQQDLLLEFNCNPFPIGEYKSFVYEEMETTDALPGPYHQFKNNTDYEVFVVVFENKTSGKSYGKLIPRGGHVSIGLKVAHTVFFYIGNDMTRFNPARFENKGYGSIKEAEKVAKKFNAHFCEMDYNTLMALSKIYTVKQNSSTGGTTTIKGNYYDGFSIESVVLTN
jgi:hypothetical protein